MTNAEKQISRFFKRYEPAVARLGRALRARLKDRLPGLNELVYVYKNQESLMFSYSPTEAGVHGVCAIAIYPGRVDLCVTGGDLLSKSDPSGLLAGQGKMVRRVALRSVAEFDRPEIEVLLAAALKIGKVRLDPGAKGVVVIKAGEQKQRALRKAKPRR